MNLTGNVQNSKPISDEIGHSVAKPVWARQKNLARTGGLFRRAAAVLLFLVGAYLLLLLEQIPATAAQQVSAAAPAGGSRTPHPASLPITVTITPTITMTPTWTATPQPHGAEPITLTPAITPTVPVTVTVTPTLIASAEPTATVYISSTPTMTPSLPTPESTATSTPGAPPEALLPGPPAGLNDFDPLPTATVPLPEPTAIPIADDPHVAYVATTGSCAGCHRSHTSAGQTLRGAWPEEDLCFVCHTSAGPGTDVQTAFTSYTNTDTSFFKHDVAATSGLHHLGEDEGPDFGGENRHVECEDCHEPHEATRGPAGAPLVQREMNYTSGVDPLWVIAGAPDAYTWLPQAEREYQVCFKCHSGFTALPGYAADGLPKLSTSNPSQVADSRDLAQEFNPYHASFHPVVTQGRNQSIPAESFVNGWSVNSMTYCTDCHANPAAGSNGPHGSPLLHLLDGQSDYSTLYTSGSRVDRGEVCFQCHNYDTYVMGTNDATNFREHSGHLNNMRGTTCYTCHDTHGSEQLHLINFDASTMTFPEGLDSQTAWYIDENGQAGCYLVCHGRRHNPATYTP